MDREGHKDKNRVRSVIRKKRGKPQAVIERVGELTKGCHRRDRRWPTPPWAAQHHPYQNRMAQHFCGLGLWDSVY